MLALLTIAMFGFLIYSPEVEPFQRGLKTLNTDCMINGRTRWQGYP